jgi:hypothetical protein
MLLVVVRVPASSAAAGPDPERSARAAKVADLSVADVRHRLQGTLPRVLLNDADGDRLGAIGDRLDELGFATVVCDPRVAPTDADRIIARGFRFQPDRFIALDSGRGEHECPFGAVEAIQRGTRVTTQSTKEKTVEHKFDVGRAVLSSGLILTRKEVKETVRKTETTEPFALVQRNDGEPDIMLYERRIDYRALGSDMQPSSRANLEAVVRKLRAAAPAAAYDDRVARPGFISALPATPVDPVDLALHLVSLALRRAGA